MGLGVPVSQGDLMFCTLVAGSADRRISRRGRQCDGHVGRSAGGRYSTGNTRGCRQVGVDLTRIENSIGGGEEEGEGVRGARLEVKE